MDLRGYKKYIFDPEAFLRRKAKFFASQGSSLPTRLERSCWPLDASKRERRQARLAQHGKTARASKAQAMLPTHGTFQEALKKTQMAFSSWPSLIDPPASPPCLLKKISFTLTSRKAKGLEALEHSLRLPPLRLLPPFRLSVFRLPPPSPYGWLASSPPPCQRWLGECWPSTSWPTEQVTSSARRDSLMETKAIHGHPTIKKLERVDINLSRFPGPLWFNC